ncbi:MAG: FAD-dependent oxidoreductase [Pseudolabrys sp.]|nr:FAD-dependent oxidoreductase [Pseudolabrys sp.]
MPLLDRRTFLAASGALAATGWSSRALGQVPASGDVDVIIIGAGAAGIAAARRVAAAGLRYALLEAAPRIGGRCVTDTAAFGVPYDMGAHWIHKLTSNPLAQLGGAGFDLYAAPRAGRLRVPPRAARESELEQYFSALVRSSRAIMEAGRGRTDVAAATVLPGDLGPWQDAVAFALGPYSTGKELKALSAVDFARAGEREGDGFCRQGYGALLAKLAEGLRAQVSTPVTRFDWSSGLEAQTPRGRIRGRAAIVTASVNVLARGGINFAPDLPPRVLNAARAVDLGFYEHVALELPGNPLGLENDDLVFAAGAKPAALLANIGGTNLCTVDIAGPQAAALARDGENALRAYGLEWIASAFGNDVKSRVRRSSATRWSENPFVFGSFSAAAPNGADARKILMEPLRDRVFFAGEAVHETLWGTVGGAWESGMRAAEAALRRMGIKPKNEEEKPQRRRSRG